MLKTKSKKKTPKPENLIINNFKCVLELGKAFEFFSSHHSTLLMIELRPKEFNHFSRIYKY